MKPKLIQHLAGESIGRFPVWMMRQAGRYIPAYREVRKEHSFWEMVESPELVSKVSLMPLEILDVDAVIFFSDILTPPFGMDLGVQMKEGVGPVMERPFRTPESFAVFENFDAGKHTPYVGDALKLIASQLPEEKALFGFAGAPWTVGAYLIEGRGSKEFHQLKNWAYRDPESLRESLSLYASATKKYLAQQAESGTHALQLFDTWASQMPLSFFKKHYVPILNDIFDSLKDYRLPLIYFFKHAAHLWDAVQDLNVDILGVDSLTPLETVEAKTGGKFSLQGNLDAEILLTDEATIRNETQKLVASARRLKKPAILNLGHGIFKDTPVSHAKIFIDEAKRPWT